MAAALSVSGAGPGAELPVGAERAPEEELPPLEPAEVRSRLEHSARQFRNRRKVLIRGLPADVTNQDVHELLKDYELKYCFVDKFKGTAFVTLQDSTQASSAILHLHGSFLRSSELRLQLQPSDSVLCVANLPQMFSQLQFEELLRPFGSLERCFLIYSPTSGHSKGYGFVEFMKKDSAARARSELLGKRLGSRTLFVHWAEAEQLRPELLHSRCLCVEKLPHNYCDLQGLRRAFGAICEPSFCQLARGQDGQLKGFAVLEFPSAEAAECAQRGTDGMLLAGSHIRVSFCAPGLPGPSMLAALIAAQATAQQRGKGLLPEPSLLQILSRLSPAGALPVLLLRPLLQGAAARQGILGAAPSLPLGASPALPSALLQLHSQKPGILGDSPLSSLAQPPGKLLAEIPSGGSMPVEVAQSHSQLLPPFREGLRASGTPQGPPKPNQGESRAPKVSLLGEPPKDLKIPLNPYLNLQSLLPPGVPGKGFKGKVGIFGHPQIPNPSEHPEIQGQDLGFRSFAPNREQLGAILGGFRSKVSPSPPGLDRSSLAPSASPLFSGSQNSFFSSGLQAGLRQSHLSKTPLKRGSSHLLPSPEPSPEGSYVGQHSQGLGGHYADSYLKRKRIF